MTNYRNGPQQATTDRNGGRFGHNGPPRTAKETEWAAGTARETDWSARDCHEMQGKWS